MGSNSDILKALVTIVENSEDSKVEDLETQVGITAAENEIAAEETEETSEVVPKAKRATLAISKVKAQISADAIASLDASLAQIKEQAGIIAKEIEAFRAKNNIQSDLIGPELIDNIAISIVRSKIYYWLSFFTYHKFVNLQTDVPNAVIWGKMLNPNAKELADMEDFFSAIPKEYLDIILSKNDILTKLIKKSEGAKDEFLAQMSSDKKTSKPKAATGKTKLKKSKIVSDAAGALAKKLPSKDMTNMKESMIASIISIFFEAVEKEDDKQRLAHLSDKEGLEGFDVVLPQRLLSSIVSRYAFANKKDINTIDDNIFFHFAAPSGVKQDIWAPKASALGIKSKVEKDPETGKQVRVDDPNALVQGGIARELDTNDEGVATNRTYFEAEPEATSQQTEEEIMAKSQVSEADKAREKAFTEAAPKIFTQSNLAINYFNNKNFAAIVCQLLETWKTNESYALTYIDNETHRLVSRSLSLFFREYSKYYIEDVWTSTPAEAFEILSEGLDILLSPVGAKRPISDEVVSRLIKKFQIILPQAFDLSILSGIQKTEVARALGVSGSFDLTNKTQATDFKSLVINKIQAALASEQDIEKQKVLRNALEVVSNTDPTDTETITKVADLVLSQNILTRVKNKANIQSDDRVAGIAASSDVLGKLIFDNLSTWDPINKVKTFKFNDVLYSDAYSLAKAMANMSKQDIEFLNSEIQNGTYGVPTKGQLIPFYQLKGGPAKKNQDKMTANFNTLLSLKESRLVEDVDPTNDLNTILTNTYIKTFVTASAPILQEWEVIIKRVPIFLINVSTLLKKYAEFLKERGSEKTLNFGSLTKEQQKEIEAFITYVVGKSRTGDTLKAFNEDLRRLILEPSKIEKLTSFFLEVNKNPDSVFFKPVQADFIMRHYSMLKTWLTSIFSKYPSILKELEHIFEKDAAEHTFERLRTFLLREIDVLLPLAAKEHKAEKLMRTIRGITSGLYEYIPEEPENEEQPHEEVALPNDDDAALKKRMEELEALANSLDF